MHVAHEKEIRPPIFQFFDLMRSRLRRSGPAARCSGKSGGRPSLINLSSEALAAEVANLRCGLDRSNWSDSVDWPETTEAEVQRKRVQKAAFERCQSLGRRPSPDGSLPFDVDRAHRLYKLFLGPPEKAIAGKHLLIVPSESLMQLPFATLVTEQPAPDTNLRDLKWLGTTAPISILPSVSSLRALRRVSKPSQASKPFLGFGNPLLNGDPAAAKLARSKQTCAPSEPSWTASVVSRPVRTPMKLLPSEAFRGGPRRCTHSERANGVARNRG